jgi:hypothetical protein
LLDLNEIETELKKRNIYPYRWGQKQNDEWDRLTNFIYTLPLFDGLLSQIKKDFATRADGSKIFDYTINRWYNFWSAQAVENIFCSMPCVTASTNSKNRLEDFSIHGITFDHKTSVFPKDYGKSLEQAQNNPKELIEWLYQNQSTQQRFHRKNRLFIVLYSSTGSHWKLKAEIGFLEGLIRQYVTSFDPSKLHSIVFENNQTALSDIIWGIKQC